MADIRTLFGISRDKIALQAQAGVPAGFTVGNTYLPMSFGVDIAVSPTVVYGLLANDTGHLVTVPLTNFALITQ